MFQLHGQKAVQAARGSGTWITFLADGNGRYAAAGVLDSVVPVSGGWQYVDAQSKAVETYDPAGLLKSVSYADGRTLIYVYSDATTPAAMAPVPGLLIRIQDQQSRSIQFHYQQATRGPRIYRVVDPAGQAIAVAYNTSGELQQLGWPDGKTRQFLYENSKFPWALTGVVDENNARLTTYRYDDFGRAVETQAAGGVDHFVATYTSPPAYTLKETYDPVADVLQRDHLWQAPQGTTVTLPGGGSVTLEAKNVLGMPRMTVQSQPAGAGCAAANSYLRYDDTNGNMTSRDDFNGKRVCYGHDSTRNLETVRVEGLSNTAACGSYTPPGVALPAEARKVSTQWHPGWSLQTKVAEPRRIVTTVYNGQPDPFASNAIASCAPADAKLPDGKPIAVVCKRVEHATTDVDGSKGFSAPLATGVAPRQWSYTYKSSGQVLSEDGPRTDLTDITRYEYYPDTTADWTQGDLKQVTNPTGQVTKYTRYNAHGQVLSMSDANGVVTTYTYDVRQRLKTVTVGTELTKYDYYPTGLLQRVTQPDLSY
ncbi:hypothetical protein OOT46_25985, partial [Aquabacterium sp. A7-Y]|nr:hypothetical protein [Aquabacterium sp. A7-Y]